MKDRHHASAAISPSGHSTAEVFARPAPPEKLLTMTGVQSLERMHRLAYSPANHFAQRDKAMGFKEAVRTVLKEKYATFQGRAPRSEFWWFVLFVTLVGVVLMGLAFALDGGRMMQGRDPNALSMIFFGLYAIFYLAVLIPGIAVSVRRLHDRNMSGWWYLGMIVASFIPFVGIIASLAFLVIMCLKGTDGENKYGPDPLKGPANAEVFS